MMWGWVRKLTHFVAISAAGLFGMQPMLSIGLLGMPAGRIIWNQDLVLCTWWSLVVIVDLLEIYSMYSMQLL